MLNTVTEEYSPYEEKQGSVLTGLVGAVLGALLGAVAWAAVAILLDIIAGLLGLLIGFLASKGYDLFKGRTGKAKLVCVILAVIIGVVAGTGATYGWIIHAQYVEDFGRFAGSNSVFALTEQQYFERILSDGDVTAEIVKNLGLGLLFAGLGCMDMFKELASGNKRNAAPDLSAATVPFASDDAEAAPAADDSASL